MSTPTDRCCWLVKICCTAFVLLLPTLAVLFLFGLYLATLLTSLAIATVLHLPYWIATGDDQLVMHVAKFFITVVPHWLDNLCEVSELECSVFTEEDRPNLSSSSAAVAIPLPSEDVVLDIVVVQCEQCPTELC